MSGQVLGTDTIGTGTVLGAATTGAAAVILPQTGILPVTGSVTSMLVLVTITMGIAIVVSLVITKIQKRRYTHKGM